MDRERWQRIGGLFDEAMDRSAAERGAFLREACGADAELLAELQALIRASAEDGRLDDAVGRAVMELTEEPVGPATMLGAFRLTEVLGAGGMGTVYRGERTDGAFEQQVAIKVARAAGFDALAESRLRAERQILADLAHPHIARLLDGGTTPGGAPYVVMEYVDGAPLDQWAKAHPLASRIDLFVRVCDAVDHANRRLVVHRDLKPANILVTADGAPKLLDFGIARLLDTTRAALTAAPLMTLAYASPEQMRGEPVGVASDVYSLGVVLYELLTGTLPHDLHGASVFEAERVVTQAPPPPPSQRVEGVDRDLDAIVLQALRADPDLRYRSVAALAYDLENWREGRPVTARAPTVVYRLGKLVRRHAGLVSLATVALLALIVSLGIAVDQGLSASRARDAAKRSLATSEAVTAYLIDVLGTADPREHEGDEPTVREALDRGRAAIDDLADQPEVRAQVLATLGTLYFELGHYDVAVELRDQVVAHRRRSAEPEALLDALNLLARAHLLHGQRQVAADLMEEALTLGRDLFGPDASDVLGAQLNLAVAYNRLGRSDEAEALVRDVVRRERATLDADDPMRAYALNNLSLLVSARGRWDESEALARESWRVRRAAYGDGDPRTQLARLNLGVALREADRLDAAEPHFRAALDGFGAALGPAHPRVAEAQHGLGAWLVLRADPASLAEAEPMLNAALTTRTAALGAQHPAIAWHTTALGLLEARKGRLEEAAAWLGQAVALRREVGEDAPHALVDCLVELALVRAAMGDAARAGQAAMEAVTLTEARLSPDHVVGARARVVERLLRGAPDAEVEVALDALRSAVGDEHRWVVEVCQRADLCER